MIDRLRRLWRMRFVARDWGRVRRAFGQRSRYYELISALITALVIINATASGVELGNQAYSSYVKTQLADDIEQMVDVWSQSIDERERAHRIYAGQGISPYRATLERELLQQFAPQARELADRLRNARDDELKQYGTGQLLQQLSSGLGGGAVGGVLGKEAGDAVGKLLEWEWNAAAIAQNTDSENISVNWEAKAALMRQLMGHLAGTELDSWDKAEPLLQARAYRSIRYLQLNQDQWSDEEYAQHVRERALSLAREFGLTGPQSEDSPFKDFAELMSWLAAQTGRNLPGEEPVAEPSPTNGDSPALPTATPAAPDEPASTHSDAEIEYVRIFSACSNSMWACADAYCAKYDDSEMCHTWCAQFDNDLLKAMFDEDIWAQDDQTAACCLAVAETYLQELQRAHTGVAAGTMDPTEGFQIGTSAKYAAQDANEKCITSACQTVCAMQGQSYAVVYGRCKCK